MDTNKDLCVENNIRIWNEFRSQLLWVKGFSGQSDRIVTDVR